MVARQFSNIAVVTTLSSGIGSGDASLTVVSATGWPAAPFILVIEPELANEELILVGAKAGAVFSSLTRGFGGTSGVAHNAGVTIKHVSVAEDHSLTFTHIHVPGTDSTAQIDHGELAGLSDDDHAEYLKDKANGGLAAEVPTHTHADAANAGQFDHGNAAGLVDDDHTQYLNSARHNDAEHAAINHDALAGLADDDHTQYPLKSIATTKGDLWVATGAGVLVRVGVGSNFQGLVADSGESGGVKWNDGPLGVLGRVIRISDDTPTMPGPSDVAGLSVTVTAESSRLIQVSSPSAWSGGGGELFEVIIREGTTDLAKVRTFGEFTTDPMYVSVLLTPSSGSHTYKLSAERLTGSTQWTLNASSDRPAYVLVEDIGPA